MRKRETMRIRITRPGGVNIPVIDFGRARNVNLVEGLVIHDVRQITKAGNAVVGLAYDEPTVVPAGAFEVIEHMPMLVIDNGKNHVECDCGWTQAENKNHPEPIAALRKSGATHERYMEAIR